jgi:YD repeat-containing protein
MSEASQTTYYFRSYGNPDQQLLMSIAAPDSSANVILSRDSKDLMRSITQAGLTRRYEYDGRGYLSSVTKPRDGNDKAMAGMTPNNMTSKRTGGFRSDQLLLRWIERLYGVEYPYGAPAVTKTYTATHRIQTVRHERGHPAFRLRRPTTDLTDETLVVGWLVARFCTTSYKQQGPAQFLAVSGVEPGRELFTRSTGTTDSSVWIRGRSSGIGHPGRFAKVNYANGTTSS